MTRYALVIGISKYDKFTHLPKAATDAEVIAQLLEQHRYTVIRLPRKLVSENQWAIDPDKKLTASELSAELKSFLRDRATRQEVVIYFAGHGFRVTDSLTDEEVGYLATSDSTKDGQNAVRIDALNTLIGKSDLGSLVMLLDCCYAGTLIEQRSLLQPTQGAISQKQSYCLIAACRDFERAREGEEHGIFTAAVLRGLSAENAANGDITSTDLFGFVSRVLQPSGQEVIHAGMGQSIPLVTYAQPSGASGQRKQSPQPNEQSPAEHCQAYDLAQKLQAWFETLGYRFERHQVWTEDAFEWIINIPVRRNRYDRILVRGISGEAGLREIASLRQSVDQQRTDEGWLVTTRRISRAARDEVEKPENEQLGCYTFDELLDQDADFSGYLTWLEAEIQQRDIENRYVPLACTKEEFDPDTKQRIGVSRYDERDGWIDGYIDLWLDDPAKEHLSILGEFGTGKTWFAFHYAWKALQRYQDARRRGVERPRLPLVIPLRDYAKAVSVESLFSEFFFRKHEIPIPGYTAFEQLNRMGKLLLIFDGFDEMAARVDRQQMINNFWELAKVVVPGSKVILTCRTEHFPEAKEGRALLNAELQASTKGLTGETPQFEVLELEKFSDTQIRQVLSLQTQSETVEQVMNNAQLLDLARRPVMTELILEALPDIEVGKPVDMSRVYLYAVRRKMERDIKAERTFTSLADKLYFLCELSWEMLSNEQMSLNYRQFPDRIRRLFGNVVQEEKDLDHWHYDMMSQTMLIRNANGDYMPAHRSLLEFFVAHKFAAELGALAPDFLELAQIQSYLSTSEEPKEYTWSGYFCCDVDRNGDIIPIAPLKNFVTERLNILRSSFGKTLLSKAVADLLLPIIQNVEGSSRLLEVLDKTRNRNVEQVGYVGGNAASLLIKNDYFALEGRDLSRAIILGADFSYASLRNANFTEANLAQSVFPQIFGSVFTVAFSPSGDIFASGGASCEVRLWNAREGKQISCLKGHSNWVRRIVFSSDGTILASSSFDQTIRLWDVKTGGCIRVFEKHIGRDSSLTFIPNSNILISGSAREHTIRFWDISTGECLKALSECVYALGISSDGSSLVSGNTDRSIIVWDTQTGKCRNVLDGHGDAVTTLSISSDNTILATSGRDKTIRLWNFNTGQPIKSLEGHTEWVRTVVFSPDSQVLASSSYDTTIKLWKIDTGECIRTLSGHTNWVRAIAFSPDGSILISGSDDQTIREWDVNTGQCLRTFSGCTKAIRSLAISEDGEILASGTESSVVKLWNTKTNEYYEALRGHSSRINSVAISSGIIASSGYDETVKLWDISTGNHIATLSGYTTGVDSIAISPNGKILASGSADRLIRLWDIQEKTCLKILEGHTDWVWSVTISQDGLTLVSGGYDKTIKIWDIATGACIRTLYGHDGFIHSVAISPDAKIIASGSDDTTIRLWNPETGDCLMTFHGHTSAVNSVVFNPDQHLLASGSNDETVRVWEIYTGKCLRTFQDHTDRVSSVVFNPSSHLLYSGSWDETIKVWDLNQGICLQTLAARPYEGMNITGIKGLTDAEITTLQALGAIEEVV